MFIKDRKVLAVLSHTPDPSGSPADRKVYKFLSWLAGAASLSCVSEAPPLAAQLLKAGLASKGVELMGEGVPDEAAVYAKLRGAVRSRRFDAVILVGPQVTGRWARPLRLLIPRQVLFCYFPDASALTHPMERYSASLKQGARVKWRGLLSLADGIWSESDSDSRSLSRLFSLDPERMDVLPSVLNGGGARWFALRLARRAARRSSLPKDIDLVCLEDAGPAAELFSDAVKDVVGRRPRLRRVGRVGLSDPAALNRAISAGTGEFVLIALHPLASSENLVRTLLEGMHVLPYAGAAAPLDFSALRPGLKGSLPMKEGLFAAAWALKNKGSWHEVDYLEHFCCLLLRRSAWNAAGRLDERFHCAEFAWLDYFLRLQQSGHPVLLAQDALAFCRQDAKRSLLGGDGGAEVAADRDLLVEKWCKSGLKFMESLLTSLEPKGYRSDPRTVKANS